MMLFMKMFSDSVFLSSNSLNRVEGSLNMSDIKSFPSVPAGHVFSGGSFLGHKPVTINIHQIIPTSDNWIFYVLFASLVFLSILRYYYPVPLAKLLSFSSRIRVTHSKEDNKGTSGILVPFFLFLNFLIGLSLLVIALAKLYSIELLKMSSARFLILIMGLILGFYLLRQSLVLSAGFLFDTRKAALRHVQTTTTTVYFSGLFLSPMMLVYFYTQMQFFIYLTLSILILLWMIKWFKVIKIGLAVRKFNTLHIFLYLCTVEFLPLLLLVKVGIEQLKLM